MAIAYFTDPGEIAGHRRGGPDGRTDDGLGEESDHGVRSELQDHRFELVRDSQTISLFGFTLVPAAVGVAGRDMRRIEEKRFVRRPAHGVAADGQSAERVPVIALPPGNEPSAPRFTDIHAVLTGELERGVHGFRAAANEVDAFEAGRRNLAQQIGEVFLGTRREECRVYIGERLDLIEDRLTDI